MPSEKLTFETAQAHAEAVFAAGEIATRGVAYEAYKQVEMQGALEASSRKIELTDYDQGLKKIGEMALEANEEGRVQPPLFKKQVKEITSRLAEISETPRPETKPTDTKKILTGGRKKS